MAVVKEDVVKLTFKFDDKEMVEAEIATDELLETMRKLGGKSGTGKAEDGFEDAAKAAKKFGGTDLSKLSSGIDSIVRSVGKFTAKATTTTLKGIAVGATATATALTALGTAAVKGYAEYEQLVGGVETLFGTGGMNMTEYAKSVGKTTGQIGKEYATLQKAQNTVFKNANNAYKSAGMDANAYMNTVTSFSASMIASLGGDTVKAAKLSDQAIIDMADNANKMGSDLTSLTDAYKGFSRGQFQLLDNLKLGYGGTKEEMQRLLKDAQKISGVKYDISNFADITEAIHVIQTELGITGTTAKEASETIQGSALAMKAAFQNFVTGMANEDADFDQLLNNLVDSVKTFLKNIIPRIKKMLPRMVKGLTEITKVIGKELPGIISDLAPALVDGTVDLMGSMYDAFLANVSVFKKIGLNIVKAIYKGITGKEMSGEMFAALESKVDKAFDAVRKITKGLIDFGSELLHTVGPALEWIGDLALDAFSWIGDNIDWIVKALGALLGAMLAFKAVKGVSGIVSGFMGIFGKGKGKGGAGGDSGGLLGGFDALNPAKMLKSFANIALIVGGLTLVVIALGYVAKLDFDYGKMLKLIGMIAVVGLVGTALAGLAGMVGAIPITVVLTGLANIALALGAFTAVVAAFGALAKVDGITEFLNTGGDMLSNLCRILGEMAGSLIGGIGEGVTNSLPAIGENLSAFAASIKPMLETFASVDTSGLSDFSLGLAALIAVLAGESLLSLITGGINYTGLGENLNGMATSMSGFFDTIMTFPDGGFEKATALFDCLAGIKSLPNDGGVVGWFAGEVNFANIAQGVQDLASAGMIAALTALAAVPETAWTALTSMFDALAGIKAMPKEGGIAGWFAGDSSTGLNNIASQLPAVATNIASFFTNLGGITDFSPISNLFNTLSDIKIDSDVAEKGFWSGVSQLGSMGTELSTFAKNASTFFTTVNDLNTENVNAFFDVVGKAGDLPTQLEGVDGTLGTTLSNMVTTVETGMTNIKTAITTGLNNCITTINGFAQGFFSSGQAIMSGLNNGILSKKASLMATARSIASSIKKEIDTAMDIHSPSRVTQESGRFISLGLAKGMVDSVPDVQVAARKVSNATIPYAGNYSPESSSTTYNSGGNTEYTTVSPVFNLTISGSQDDRAMARKVKRYVADAIRDTFDSLERKSYVLREV